MNIYGDGKPSSFGELISVFSSIARVQGRRDPVISFKLPNRQFSFATYPYTRHTAFFAAVLVASGWVEKDVEDAYDSLEGLISLSSAYDARSAEDADVGGVD